MSARALEKRPFSEDTCSNASASFLGPGASAKVLIALLTSAVFALGHYANLGVPGVEQAMITGLVFGAIFAVTGRIWMVMCAHAAFDLTAVAIIYWNLEAAVAHLVFK